MMSLAAIIDPLRAANRVAGEQLFTWQILSVTGAQIELTCGVKISCDGALDEAERSEVLIVLGGFRQEHHLPNSSLPKLIRAARSASLVFGVEAGTWLLSRSGLLSNHRVTTHWEDLESLAEDYPDLTVVADRFVIDRTIWTSGGASPTVDMMLHYLRHTHSQTVAMNVANVFIYQGERAADRQQTDLVLRRLRNKEPRVAQTMSKMRDNLETPLSIAQFASNMKVSRRTLEQLFRKFLNQSPAAYYLQLRLQTARRLVVDSQKPMLEIALQTGFSSPTSFSRAFKQYYGASPVATRQHYSSV